jgi:hypothetical protein
MKVTRYYCDVCGRDIVASAADDVKGINLRIELDHGKYESVVFSHACSICQTSLAEAIRAWVAHHKKGTTQNSIIST